MTVLRQRVRDYFDSPNLWQVAPLGLVAGCAGVMLGVVIGLPGAASTGLGMVRRIVGGVRLLLVVGVLVVLAGCGGGGSSFESSFEVEAEHSCEDSRYITITNIRTSDMSLEGWTITNEGFVFTFPKMALASGSRIRVWRGVGTSDKDNLYLGESDALWEVRNRSLVFERPPSATPAFGMVEMYFLGCHASPPMNTVQPSEMIGGAMVSAPGSGSCTGTRVQCCGGALSRGMHSTIWSKRNSLMRWARAATRVVWSLRSSDENTCTVKRFLASDF